MGLKAISYAFLSSLLACHAGSGFRGDSAPPSAKSLAQDSMGRIEDHLIEREYWASETTDGLQAPNRAHDLRTYFDGRGVRVQVRDASERTPLVELGLAAIGRGTRLSPIPMGLVVDRGEGRVEIRRDSLGVVEWFENSSAGLEQGFTFASRPASAGVGEVGDPSRNALIVELAVRGSRATLSGESVLLATTAGRRLDYGHLVVVDAQGIELASHFEVPNEDRIRIVVDDRDATYPVVIDPLLTRTADTILESNQVDGFLGQSAASAGDVNGDGYDDMISTRGNTYSPPGSLAVYIHHGGPTGIASGGPAGAATVLTLTQGYSELRVASAGDVNGDGYDDVIVGSYAYDAGQGIQEGAAFVYLGGPSGVASGNETTAAARLEGDQAVAHFGGTIASAGDVNGDGYADVIVGARLYDNGQADEGAAFVFLGSSAGIANGSPATAHARLESDQPGARMGSSVASAGDMNGDGLSDVIVGSGGYHDGELGEGAAFAFLGSASGIANGNPFTAHSRIQSNLSNAGSSRDGAVVASLGDVDGDGYGDVGLGFPNYNSGRGAVFVFRGSATGLVADGSPADAATSLINPTLGVNIFFPGHFGDTLAAGDLNGDGHSDLVVGAPSYSLGQDGEGAVFIYFGSATGITGVGPSTASVTLESNQASTADIEDVYLVGMGRTMDVGDTNGDGYGDLITGLQRFTIDQSNEGAVFAYHGGSRGISRQIGLTSSPYVETHLESIHELAFGGTALFGQAIGDLNGDGYGDLAVGVPGYDAGQVDEGAVFLFLGSADGLAGVDPIGRVALSSAHARLESDQADALFGWGVSSTDVNGDGFADLIVGSLFYDGGQTNEGAAFVFLGSSSGFVSGSATAAHARLETNQADAWGVGVAAGDVNGDGFGDVGLNSPRYDAGQTDEGALFVFHGSPSGIANGNPTTANGRFETNQGPSPSNPTGRGAGAGTANAGDVNGDGFGDLVVISPSYDVDEVDESAAFILLGSVSGIGTRDPSSAHARFETNQSASSSAGTMSGASSAGDVNGDGFGDLVFTSEVYSESVTRRGAAWIVHGSASGLANLSPATANTRLVADQSSSFGSANLPAGDLNGDGYTDLVLGAAGYDFDAGTAGVQDGYVVFHGAPTGIADGGPANADVIVRDGDAGESVDLLGQAYAAGDLDGDGFGDLLVDATEFEVSINPGTRFMIHLGNGDARSARPRQRRGDGSGLIVHPRGSAVAPDRFVAELFARSPRGREWGKLEVEACRVGTAFGAPSCVRSTAGTWTDLGTVGSPLAHTVAGLTANTLYSWRGRVRMTAYQPTPPPAGASSRMGPWFRVQARAEPGDIRTPEPGFGAGIAAGIAAACVLGRGRLRRGQATQA